MTNGIGFRKATIFSRNRYIIQNVIIVDSDNLTEIIPFIITQSEILWALCTIHFICKKILLNFVMVVIAPATTNVTDAQWRSRNNKKINTYRRKLKMFGIVKTIVLKQAWVVSILYDQLVMRRDSQGGWAFTNSWLKTLGSPYGCSTAIWRRFCPVS